MSNPTDSFVVSGAKHPYIEPFFTKSMFEVERPTVLLVSAVGATGKTALAQVLSHNLQLPLLNLTRHKPVGDSTLTGLVTASYPLHQIGSILEALAAGTYGIIIDGIDEGRSKTTEQGFQAFLDDIALRCKGATSPTFVLLGRTQILEECWMALEERGVSTGLLTIDPFSKQQACSYIDNFTNGTKSAQALQYIDARDLILTKLSTAFTGGDTEHDGTFLSFIGYPPVLDAIVTLLSTETNYHKLREQITHASSQHIEIELLRKISEYILTHCCPANVAV